MKKIVAFTVILAVGFMAGVTAPVLAQKKHTPKTSWQAMLAGLNDIQGITAALAVFDMKRAGEIADGLVKRETFISKIPRLSDASKAGHAKVATAATGLSAAIKSGEEKDIAMKIGEVLAACSECHYNVRDAAGRK